MSSSLKLVFCMLLAALLLSACATPEKPLVANGVKTVEPQDRDGAEQPAAETLEIQRPYDRRSLMLPVLQYRNFMMSYDYFFTFAWGDEIFTDFLFRIFRLEESPYQEGDGTVLTTRSPDGSMDHILEKALIRVYPDGSKWWQVRQYLRGMEILYEVLISELGVPMLVRYVHPETGEKHERGPFVTMSLENVLQEMTMEELKVQLTAQTEEAVEQAWNGNIFHDAKILGEETIEVAAGVFRAVHIRDEQTDGAETITDYWISPDVPGNLVKVHGEDRQQGREYTVELTALHSNKTGLIHESEIVPESLYEDSEMSMAEGMQEGVSEGSPEDPVELAVGELYYGSVGPESISYYKINVRKRSDIFVEVSDFPGFAELYDYGTDSTYQDWLSGSSGSTMDLQAYFTEPGTTLYFTIEDIEDEYAVGETYTIFVSQSFILDSTGILIRGEIYKEAVALESGNSYLESLGADGLNYYKTTIQKGPHLMVSVENLLPSAGLCWFEAQNGSYTSAGVWVKQDGVPIMEVKGLSPGTICYYYIAGNTDPEGGGLNFRITVEEMDE